MCKNPENMTLYNAFRECPKEAQKPITEGRLKGKTDINPMWRLKMLTEQFGPCGIGWTTRIVRTWIEDGAKKRQFNDRGEVIGESAERTANVEIALRYKYNGEWSEDIPGIGGAMFVKLEGRGFNTEDEAFKKAYTDAISVACKALGIAANIYYDRDPDSKYETGEQAAPRQQSKAPVAPPENYGPAPFLTGEGNYPPPGVPAPTEPKNGVVAIPKTREEAAAIVYGGMTLTKLYKTNYPMFMQISKTEDPVLKAATAIILDWVAENNDKTKA